ncbi:MAG: hydrogenase iron-sulfur subunit [Firmicutes bacterium]|nr:hydrogenase iron-sulfur subunit [Bacillota bacterium]
MSRSKTLVLGEEDFARRLADGLSGCGPVEVIPWDDGCRIWSLGNDADGIQMVVRDRDQGSRVYREFRGDSLVLALKTGFVLPPFAVEALKIDPRIIPLTELASRLGVDYPPPAEHHNADSYNPLEGRPSQAAIIVDGVGLESTAPTRAALLCAASLAGDGAGVTVFYRSLALAGGENDRCHNQARDAGVGFIRYQELPAIERGSDGRISLGFADASLPDRFRLTLSVDLLALAEEHRETALQDEVFRLLGWEQHLGGFNLDDNNLHYWQTRSPRRGLYWVTSESWREQLPAVVDSIRESAHTSRPPETVKAYRVIDPYRCQLCLTCRRACPHGAIEVDSRSDRPERGMMYQAAARIEPERCFDCGICEPGCPAMAIGRADNRPAEMVLGVDTDRLLIPASEAELAGAPYRITAFACKNSGYLAVKEAAVEGEQMRYGPETDWTAAVRVRLVNCAGDVSALDVWDELSRGADGIIVWSCHPGACQHLRGSQLTRRRMERLGKELRTARGKEPPLLFQAVAPNNPFIILDTIHRLTLRIKQNRGGVNR